MAKDLPGFPIDSAGAGGNRKNGFQRAMHKSTMHATKSSGRCENCKNATLHIQMDEPQSRRTLLSWLVGGGVAATLGSFLYPVIRFLNPPKVSEAAVNEVSAGKVQDLKPNSGKIVKFGNKPALLVRVNDTEWKAFSAVCTHLNCTVQYQDTSRQIWCACHNGTYDMSGRVVSGPPPKPLEEYAVMVRGEEVVISRRA
jgi:Rieske Fe-S protein